MSDTIDVDQRPEVTAFVEAVRRGLSDLAAEEREELTEGLAADLAELVAEQGVDALGDPAAYAQELRAAAGLEGDARRRLVPTSRLIEHALDGAHERWDRLLAILPHQPGGLLDALRPIWWAVRGWLAVEAIDTAFGSWPYSWLPSIYGPAIGAVITVAAVLLSVQIGRGKLWPGTDQPGLWARILLLGLNGFAVVVLLPVATQLPTGANLVASYDNYRSPQDLTYRGKTIANIYPYDAAGQPLTGVQLVDQDGRRIPVPHYQGDSFSLRPWTNGRTQLFSVFPLPSRTLDPGSGRPTDDFAFRPPLASLPPVTLAGVVASTLVTPAPVQVTPTAPASATPVPTQAPSK